MEHRNIETESNQQRPLRLLSLGIFLESINPAKAYAAKMAVVSAAFHLSIFLEVS